MNTRGSAIRIQLRACGSSGGAHALWVVPLRTFRCVLSPAHPPFSFTVYFAFTDTGWLEFSDAFPSRPAV